MNFSQEERVVANSITEKANELNKLMQTADAMGLTVDITPTKLHKRGGKEIRQVMVKVRAELSSTASPKEVNGNQV
jgi:hypothetical protein